jgi:hypothetical protein
MEGGKGVIFTIGVIIPSKDVCRSRRLLAVWEHGVSHMQRIGAGHRASKRRDRFDQVACLELFASCLGKAIQHQVHQENWTLFRTVEEGGAASHKNLEIVVNKSF